MGRGRGGARCCDLLYAVTELPCNRGRRPSDERHPSTLRAPRRDREDGRSRPRRSPARGRHRRRQALPVRRDRPAQGSQSTCPPHPGHRREEEEGRGDGGEDRADKRPGPPRDTRAVGRGGHGDVIRGARGVLRTSGVFPPQPPPLTRREGSYEGLRAAHCPSQVLPLVTSTSMETTTPRLRDKRAPRHRRRRAPS
jgi:hypothetical protein